MYRNEKEVGNAVRQSGIRRSDLFITTKVGNPDQGYDRTLKAFEESLYKLDRDYIDLYLVHWPEKENEKLHRRHWNIYIWVIRFVLLG